MGVDLLQGIARCHLRRLLPYPDLFQERVGLNLTALVGKTLEAARPVESPYCGGEASKGSIARRDPDLLPLLSKQFKVELEIWIVMHNELKRISRMRLMFDHLAQYAAAL